MIILLFFLLLSSLLASAQRQDFSAVPTSVEQIEQQLNTTIPVITNAVMPILPASTMTSKERIGASFMGGGVILLVASLMMDFMSTNPETRAKVVPLYISAVGAIVISFLGRFCKLFPHTNHEVTSWVSGAVGGLVLYLYGRSFYNT